MDTIFAPATGFGRSAVCVLRISGPATRAVLEAIAGGAPEARRMSLRRLRDPANGEIIDHGLVCFFPGPASFSGEDMAEIHGHGGLAVRSGLLRVLSSQVGCRPAEPGEFTRRALLNGRMDLSEVEGLADLIDAETEAQRRQALRQMEGFLGRRAEDWRHRLIAALARVEAALDFADEGDVGDDAEAEALVEASRIAEEIRRTLADAHQGERIREGFRVVLAGPPNAGKSSLLNAVAKRDVAIVSPIAGTTRDVIEVRCDFDGLPVILSDTAGLRESTDPLERQGVERARAQLRRADLILWLDPADNRTPPPPGEDVLHILTKSDLLPSAHSSVDALPLSLVTEQGLPELLHIIAERVRGGGNPGDAIITRLRHREALTQALDCLERVSHAGALELAAEDLRLAARAVGRIAGTVDVEDILDRLFASFCIGK